MEEPQIAEETDLLESTLLEPTLLDELVCLIQVWPVCITSHLLHLLRAMWGS